MGSIIIVHEPLNIILYVIVKVSSDLVTLHGEKVMKENDLFICFRFDVLCGNHFCLNEYTTSLFVLDLSICVESFLWNEY